MAEGEKNMMLTAVMETRLSNFKKIIFLLFRLDAETIQQMHPVEYYQL